MWFWDAYTLHQATSGMQVRARPGVFDGIDGSGGTGGRATLV